MPKLFTDTAAAALRGKKRETNEDTAFCMPGTPPVSGPSAETLAVVAVAGGMGGAGLGDAASGIVRAFIESIFGTGKEIQFGHQHGVSTGDYTALLSEVFHEGHRRIFQSAAQSNKSGIMGTTLALGVIVYNAADDKTYLHVGNVGNNRGYIIRGEQIFHATEEDSVAWRLYKKGEITYSELLSHPLRSQITVMGINSAIAPEVHSIQLHAGDCVLFCTDGVHESLDDAAIQRVVRTSKNAKHACERLLASASSASRKKENAAAAVAILSESPVGAGHATAGAGRTPAAAAPDAMKRSAAAAAPLKNKRSLLHYDKRTTLMIWAVVAVLAAGAAAVYFYKPGYGIMPELRERSSTHADSSSTPASPATRESPVVMQPSPSAEPRTETTRVIHAEERPAPAKKEEAVSVRPRTVESRPAPAEGVPLRVEWNAETERFRILTTRTDVVPVTLTYGEDTFDLVPVKGMPNLYRTTRSIPAESFSASRRVVIRLLDGEQPLAVSFTETK